MLPGLSRSAARRTAAHCCLLEPTRPARSFHKTSHEFLITSETIITRVNKGLCALHQRSLSPLNILRAHSPPYIVSQATQTQSSPKAAMQALAFEFESGFESLFTDCRALCAMFTTSKVTHSLLHFQPLRANAGSNTKVYSYLVYAPSRPEDERGKLMHMRVFTYATEVSTGEALTHENSKDVLFDKASLTVESMHFMLRDHLVSTAPGEKEASDDHNSMRCIEKGMTDTRALGHLQNSV